MLIFDEWIKKSGKISEKDLMDINSYAMKNMVSFSEGMVESKIIEEEEFLKYLAEYNDSEFLKALEIISNIDESLVKVINPEKAREFMFLPYKIDNEVLKIIVNSEVSRSAETYASSVILCNYVVPVYATKEELEALIDRYCTTANMEGVADISGLAEFGELANFSTICLDNADSVVTKFLNDMTKAAIETNVSDIHISPEDGGLVSIRFRRDGILTEYSMFKNQELLKRIINQIKNNADMKIEEARKTQSGHYSANYKNNTVDFRVSTLPTIYGIEKITMRILNQSSLNLSVENMKFRDENKEQFLKIIKKPQGIILMTGPTGSGKTTTLYTALATIASPEICIVTLEDPAEYRLGKNIVQTQINHKIDMDFPNMFREVLRQDPDIILVGEIRDRETATTAVQAANTGHLVFSTLHTNDSISAITRLLELGVENYNISESLIGVMAQRLVRKVCPNCKVEHEYELTQEDKEFFHTDEDKIKGYKAHEIGCPVCKYTGYKGQIPIHELLIIDDGIKRILSEGGSVVKIRDYSKENKMKLLSDDAFLKVKDGLTTMSEVKRIIG